MSFQPRRRSVLLLLALIACYAAYAYRGAGEQAAPESDDGVAQRIDEAVADAAARMPDRAAGLRTSELDVLLTDASEPVCVYVGQTLRIHLPASPAIGYEWALEDDVPPLLRMETDPGNAPASVLSARTGSVQTWSFRVERSGHTVLRFAYRRPWEASSVPIRTAQFEIVVPKPLRGSA